MRHIRCYDIKACWSILRKHFPMKRKLQLLKHFKSSLQKAPFFLLFPYFFSWFPAIGFFAYAHSHSILFFFLFSSWFPSKTFIKMKEKYIHACQIIFINLNNINNKKLMKLTPHSKVNTLHCASSYISNILTIIIRGLQKPTSLPILGITVRGPHTSLVIPCLNRRIQVGHSFAGENYNRWNG